MHRPKDKADGLDLGLDSHTKRQALSMWLSLYYGAINDGKYQKIDGFQLNVVYLVKPHSVRNAWTPTKLQLPNIFPQLITFL